MALNDQSQDLSGTRWHKIQSLHEVPEFVKSASDERRMGSKDDGEMFADTETSQLSLANPAAIWTSAAYLLDQQAEIPQSKFASCMRRIRNGAAYFGITAEIDKLVASFEAVEKTAAVELPDSMFAVVHMNGNHKQRYVRLANADEVKVAADWLKTHRDTFRYGDRQHIARRILEKSAEYAADLSTEAVEFLEKQAGYGTCAASEAADFVYSRLNRVRGRMPEQTQIEIRKLAEAMRTNPANVHTSEQLQKLAAVIDDLDREYGLIRDYDHELMRPEDGLFPLTKTAMSDFIDGHVTTTSGNVYAKTALSHLRHTQIADHMGSDFADAVSDDGLLVSTEKLADILPTLPRNDAERFDQLVATLGIASVMPKLAAARQGLSTDELVELAGQYELAK